MTGKLPADCNTHTLLCKHAEGNPLDYAKAAAQAGIATIAVTDNAPNAHEFDPENRMRMDEYDHYRHWIEEARNAGEVEVLRGLKVDFYQGGHHDLTVWMEEEAGELDVVLAGMPYQNYWAKNPAARTLWDGEPEEVWSRYFKQVKLLADWRMFDVMAHLDLPKKKGRRLPEERIKEMAAPALDAIAAAQMALEINTSGLVHDVGEIYPAPYLLQMAFERDIPITFGSDAHHPKRVGDGFREAVELAKSVGYGEYAVFRQRQPAFAPLG